MNNQFNWWWDDANNGHKQFINICPGLMYSTEYVHAYFPIIRFKYLVTVSIDYLYWNETIIWW